MSKVSKPKEPQNTEILSYKESGDNIIRNDDDYDDKEIQVNNSLANIKLKDNSHSRTLCTVPDDSKNSFFVGVTGINSASEIYIVNYNELDKKLDKMCILDFNTLDKSTEFINEILGIYPININDFFVQVFNFSENCYKLKYIKSGADGILQQNLEALKSDCVFDINHFSEGSNKRGLISFITSKSCSYFDLAKNTEFSKINLSSEDTLPLKISSDVSKIDQDSLGIGLNSDIFLCDLKSGKVSTKIEKAHESSVLSLQFDPTEPFILCTSGTDFALKFWDVRKHDRELNGVYNNSHWIWDLKFNRNYSNVIVTSSSSSLVRNLIFSKIGDLDESESLGIFKKDLNSMTFVDYCEFEDAVYCTDWLRNDSWTFASVSFNSIFHVNAIPEEIKYKIML